MSGVPTEAEIQDQWRKTVDVLETLRNHIDSTYPGAGGKFDTLLQALEGTYTTAELPNWLTSVRGAMSACISPSTAAAALAPLIYEYGNYISTNLTADKGYGGGLRSTTELFRAIYEWCVAAATPITVKSRTITYGAAVAKTTPANAGNAVISRLTKDENNYNLEACTVEKKQFRCRADQNTGTDKWAETFEVLGQAASFDSLQIPSTGSGENIRSVIYARHAGSGSGGSLLTNSSFSEYSATGTPKFVGWTETTNGSALSQDTTNYYRTHPGATTHGSLKITAPGGAATVLIKQPLTAMRVRRLDPNVPYFLRIMVNAQIGTAVGGNVTIRLGSQSKSVAVSSIAASGWTELTIDAGTASWPKNFDQNDFDIEIEWSSTTSGFLLVDDVIFAPWDLIDGTYYLIRHTNASPTPNLVDDLYTVTDTGGAPATGKLQYWLWLSGYGYLPSSGTPNWTDP